MFVPPIDQLSKRQRQILKLAASGKRSADIAELLGLSKHTVDNHRKNILRKTGTKSTLEAVQWGMRNGVI